MNALIQPSKKEIEETISLIDKLDLTSVDIDVIKLSLKKLFTGYTLSTPILNPGVILYRGISNKANN